MLQSFSRTDKEVAGRGAEYQRGGGAYSRSAGGHGPHVAGDGRGHGPVDGGVRRTRVREEDLSFTFLYKCAEKFGVDVIELLTGENPHLTGYSLTREGAGLSIKRRAGFEYLHKAPHFRHKLAEPFVVTAPYLEEEQDVPVHLSRHEGQELDFIISGQMRFAYEDHEEVLSPGDVVMYDSGRGHGMIATGGEPCVFLAIVMKPEGEKII